MREIITRIATGEMTAYSMAWDLNRRGLLTVEGNAWDSSTLRRVVTNPLHSARAVERRYETKPPKRRRKTMDERKTKALKSSRRYLRPDELVLLVHQPPAIVSPELQDAAIAAMQRNSTVRNATRPTNRFFVLRGLVYCMAPRQPQPDVPCGYRMHGAAPPDRRPVYRCTQLYPATATRPGARCKSTIPALYLEALVWDHVRDIINHPDRLLADMRIAQEADVSAIRTAEAEVAAARRALEVVTTAVDGLGRLYRQGRIAEEDYVRQYAEACQDRETARARVAEAVSRRANLDRAGQRWADLMDFFRDLQAKLAAAEAPDEQGAHVREALIRHLVERVEIYPDGRKYLVGRFSCATRPLSERVAEDHTSRGAPARALRPG